MDLVIERLHAGQIVSCTDNRGQVSEGEVLSFDIPFRLILLKSPSSNGKAVSCNVKLFNLKYARDLKILREAENEENPLPSINLKKLSSRVRSNGDAKIKKVEYMGVNVSPMAQKLLDNIVKIIQEVSWQGSNIVVMNEVKICPPYFSNNCYGPAGSQALHLVQSLVDKFHKKNRIASSEESFS